MLVFTERFITSELDPARIQHVSGMLDDLRTNRSKSTSVSRQAIAEVAGVIAISFQPVSIDEVQAMTGRDRSVIKRSATALDRTGFIWKQEANRKGGIGWPPALLLGQPELYEAIAITPTWQSATRLCLLAAAHDMTLDQAREDAIAYRLEAVCPGISITPPTTALQ